MNILHIVGARPNFMKVAPVMAALSQHAGVAQQLVHTGQHYDANMSEIFFQQLGLPEPDLNLEIGSGSHAMQTAQMMVRLEDVVLAARPDWVVVYGDVNGTVAAALVCAKLGVPVAHVEAGLRSWDRRMPEEINRLLTDQISDLLFTPSADGDANLLCEGIAPTKIHLVGNVMIDTLVRLLPAALDGWARDPLLMPWHGRTFGLVTLHRPSNVDDPATLAPLLEALVDISARLPLLFPVHPRTAQRIHAMGRLTKESGLQICEPLGYLQFLALQKHATLVLTDSGGIQEETTFMGVPCLTLRENTERPVTTTLGTNVLIGQDLGRLRSESQRILAGERPVGQIPPLWDGQAGVRIADVLTRC